MQVSVPPHTSEAAAESAFWKLKNYLSPFTNSVDTTITRPERLRLLVVGLARRGSDYELSRVKKTAFRNTFTISPLKHSDIMWNLLLCAVRS
ncbi:hypothetical protein AVEN_180173-1 [Araneus ventricosus]|uniref:Uncharacterized protein n=1 Tax=Araneus ventricosus TaxID=182803 RepID=A0A4Y2T5U9_ARAVE|nr:hypothetical protein AVEN_180173-1 [Araneus ventricosus]